MLTSSKDNMQSSPKPTSRKKFLWWGTALLAAAATVRWLPFGRNKKPATGSTAKMLTQDGKLVEIDSRLIAGSGKKISNAELQKWIKKETPNQTEHGQQ